MKKIYLSILASLAILSLPGCFKALIVDPAGGMWESYQHIEYQDTTTKLVYLDDNKKEIVSKEMDLYASTGFDKDVAFVAKCTKRDEWDQCIATSIALMDKSGNLLNQFDEFYYPELTVYTDFPAFIVNFTPDGKLRLYPSETTEGNYIPNVGTKSEVFSHDLMLVEKDGYLGYIGRSGQIVIPPNYLAAAPFEGDEVIVIDKDGKPGSLTATGQFTPEKYACVTRLNDKYRFVNNGGTLVNYTGDLRLSTQPFYFAHSYKTTTEGDFCSGGKWGIIDETGESFIPTEYDGITLGKYFHVVKNDGKYAMLSTDAKPLSEDRFDDIVVDVDESGNVTSKFVVAKMGDKWGAVDKDGKISVPFEFEQLGKESEGFIAFKRDSKWGFIDTTGKEIFSPIYDSVEPFSGGRAPATLGGAPTNIYKDQAIKEAWLERDRLQGKK